MSSLLIRPLGVEIPSSIQLDSLLPLFRGRVKLEGEKVSPSRKMWVDAAIVV